MQAEAQRRLLTADIVVDVCAKRFGVRRLDAAFELAGGEAPQPRNSERHEQCVFWRVAVLCDRSSGRCTDAEDIVPPKIPASLRPIINVWRASCPASRVPKCVRSTEPATSLDVLSFGRQEFPCTTKFCYCRNKYLHPLIAQVDRIVEVAPASRHRLRLVQMRHVLGFRD